MEEIKVLVAVSCIECAHVKCGPLLNVTHEEHV